MRATRRNNTPRHTAGPPPLSRRRGGVEVVDDVFATGGSCYKTGLQAAFEVGGDASLDRDGGALAGVLQAKRSRELAQSRLKLLNLGQCDVLFFTRLSGG